jgi:hypothetical protein
MTEDAKVYTGPIAGVSFGHWDSAHSFMSVLNNTFCAGTRVGRNRGL